MDYFNICVDNAIPTGTVLCFSNNKPWITHNGKAALKQKRRTKSTLKEEMKVVKRALRRGGVENTFKQRIKNQLQLNNPSRVWRGLRSISGFKKQNFLLLVWITVSKLR